MSAKITVFALLALAVVASAQKDCTGVVGDITKALEKESESLLGSVMLTIIPAKFNGTVLLPTEKAFDAALGAIFAAASKKAKFTIEDLPPTVDAIKLLQSPAFTELLQLHLLYTKGMSFTAPKITNVASMLSPKAKNACPAGVKDTTVDITYSPKTKVHTFTTATGSAKSLKHVWNKNANCPNAGAYLIDAVLLPCNLENTMLVKVIVDSATAAKKKAPATKPAATKAAPTMSPSPMMSSLKPSPSPAPKSAGAQTVVSGFVMAVAGLLMVAGLVA